MSLTVRASTNNFPVAGLGTITVTPDAGSAYTWIVTRVTGSTTAQNNEVRNGDGDRVGDAYHDVGVAKTAQLTVTPVGADTSAAATANNPPNPGVRVLLAGTTKHPWLAGYWDILEVSPSGENTGLATFEVSLKWSSSQS